MEAEKEGRRKRWKREKDRRRMMWKKEKMEEGRDGRRKGGLKSLIVEWVKDEMEGVEDDQDGGREKGSGRVEGVCG